MYFMRLAGMPAFFILVAGGKKNLIFFSLF